MTRTVTLNTDTGEIIEDAAQAVAEHVADIIDEDEREHGRAPLFDRTAYEDPRLKLESKDGRRIDEIVVSFNGSIMLRRHNPDDVDLWKRLKMGAEVEFTVSGRVVGDALLLKPATETRPERLSGKRTLGVHSFEENA